MEKKFEVSKIKWDVTDDDMSKKEQKEILATLPKKVIVTITDYDVEDLNDEEEVEEYIADYLSDEYGYCHNGFDYNII